jgi:NADPH:quinone reductase-like Zn-dependent oxidoreductase
VTDARTMAAVLAHGSDPATLTHETVAIPTPAAGEVLVAVHATAITAGELAWPDATLFIPAHDVSGVVGRVGERVADLHTGHEVYGLIGFDRPGAAAEFVAVPEAQLATKPATVDHAAAATLPLGGLTAWQALVDHAAIQRGQHVLVHGGAGGVGNFTVQLAAHLGARVTATASAADAAFVAALGADTVIDYRQRFEDQIKDVDIVIDTVGGETLARSWDVLRPGGVLIGVADPPPPETAEAHRARGVYFVVEPNRDQLAELARLVDNGSLRPMIGRVFPLSEAAAAVITQRDSHIRGKVVIQVRPEPPAGA